MFVPPVPHPWSVTPREAADIQRRLSSLVQIEAPRIPLRLIAGVDAAYSRDRRWCVAGVVLWDASAGAVVEQHTARRRLRFPYVPGLLSFREAPAVIAALRRLRRTPDAIMCDAHGLAHPRRFGLASHVGVICGLPTIGCAKSRLVGSHRAPGTARGASTRLEDREEQIGWVVRTRTGVKPVFVSVGHLVDLAAARATVLECAVRYRLPEPTRLADRLVATARRDG